MIKYSEDKKVVFKSENHTYYLGDKRLTSVTSLLSEYKNEFDSDFFSKKIAKRDGKTQQEVLDEWSFKAKKSCDIGTNIHKIFEDYFLNNYSIIDDEYKFDIECQDPLYFLDQNKKVKVALKFINDFFKTKRLIPYKSEYIVYNEKIAGQVDMICKDAKGNFYILDFKTNSEIQTYSYGKKMTGVLSNIDDCSYWHYTLQLSIYKALLKKINVSKIFLVHITDLDYKFIELGYIDVQKLSLF